MSSKENEKENEKKIDVTQGYDQEEILKIKEESLHSGEEKSEVKKPRKIIRDLPVTQAYSQNEIMDIKRASLLEREKKASEDAKKEKDQ